MADLPYKSNNYETDVKMLNFCNDKRNDERCECLILPDKIYRFMKSSITPYYCWYSPCLQDNKFLTTEILEEQKLCKLNLCEISLNEVNITDGTMRVENDCASTINPSLKLSQTYINTNIFDIPNMFILNLIPVSIMLLILLWYGI